MQSIIELSRTQDEEVGDGTTSVIILGKRWVPDSGPHRVAWQLLIVSYDFFWL